MPINVLDGLSEKDLKIFDEISWDGFLSLHEDDSSKLKENMSLININSTVNLFNNEEEHGFIKTEKNTDVFVHFQQVSGDKPQITLIEDEELVSFSPDNKKFQKSLKDTSKNSR